MLKSDSKEQSLRKPIDNISFDVFAVIIDVGITNAVLTAKDLVRYSLCSKENYIYVHDALRYRFEEDRVTALHEHLPRISREWLPYPSNLNSLQMLRWREIYTDQRQETMKDLVYAISFLNTNQSSDYDDNDDEWDEERIENNWLSAYDAVRHFFNVYRANEGDWASTWILINCGVEVLNEKGGSNRITLLMKSAERHDIHFMHHLLNAGADHGISDQWGNTALHFAIKKKEAVKKLLKAKALVDAVNANGITPLMWAARAGASTSIIALIVGHANIHHQSRDGSTALMTAAKYGHANSVRTLLQWGAQPNIVDENGFTALMWASFYGQHESVDCLLKKGARKDLECKDGFTAEEWASNNYTNVILEYDLFEDDPDWTPPFILNPDGTRTRYGETISTVIFRLWEGFEITLNRLRRKK